jgi:outer membrane protein OmpA-like peptidoglycan-associated protein
MEILLGFHPRTLTKTPAPGAPAKGGPAAPTAKADTCDTPQASGTTLFFDFDSVELTDSDKMLLDGYAKAYVRLGSTAKIKVDGYASDESAQGGKGRAAKGHNDTLAQGRADQVKRYLSRAKIASGNIVAVGHGSTTAFGSDLCQNRRVMLAPALDIKVADLVEVTQTERVPGPPGSTSLGEPAKVPDIPDVPQPPETVSRAEAQAELEKWLGRLRKSQKLAKRGNTVRYTSRVRWAEETLHGRKGTGGEDDERPPKDTGVDGDGKDYEVSDLARAIANNLPDQVLKKHVDNLKKVSVLEPAQQKTLVENVRQKIDKEADRVLEDLHIPQKYWSKIKDFAKDHIPDVIDEIPTNDTFKDMLKKGYEQINKKDGDGS